MADGLFSNKSKISMISFLASDSVFFAFLITAFVFYHGGSKGHPNPWRTLDPIRAGMYSIALWGSSGTMWLSERAMRRQELKHVTRWLEATFALGVVFLIGQGLEYGSLFQRRIYPRTDLFATTFFTATGFHVLHVLFGLVMLLILWDLTKKGFGGKSYQREGYEAASYYWHFVDIVWIAIFFILYVWGTR
jgi:cytochrome c oxidase subunit III